MHIDLERLLLHRCPGVFTDLRKEGCMAWGVACEDGWFAILDRLSAELQALSEQSPGTQIIATQIKEKLGELRFYLHAVSPSGDTAVPLYMDIFGDHGHQSEVIRRDEDPVLTAALEKTKAATAMSCKTCEACGGPGELSLRGGCLQTLCVPHQEAREALPLSLCRYRMGTVGALPLPSTWSPPGFSAPMAIIPLPVGIPLPAGEVPVFIEQAHVKGKRWLEKIFVRLRDLPSDLQLVVQAFAHSPDARHTTALGIPGVVAAVDQESFLACRGRFGKHDYSDLVRRHLGQAVGPFHLTAIDRLKLEIAKVVISRFPMAEIRRHAKARVEEWRKRYMPNEGVWADWDRLLVTGDNNLLREAMLGEDAEACRLRSDPPYSGMLDVETLDRLAQVILP